MLKNESDTEGSEGERRTSNFSGLPVFSQQHSENNGVMTDSVTNKSAMSAVETTTPLNTDIFVREKTGYNRIELKDIYMVKGQRDYINIYTKKKRYTIHATLYSILEKLPKNEFVRVQRSYIVRIDRISVIHNTQLTVEGKKIIIGKLYKAELMSKLNIIG